MKEIQVCQPALLLFEESQGYPEIHGEMQAGPNVWIAGSFEN